MAVDDAGKLLYVRCRCAEKAGAQRSTVRFAPALFILFSAAGRHGAPQLQQHQHQAHAQQDVADARHAGDGRGGAGGEGSAQHLQRAPHQEHHRGDVEAGVIDRQNPPGLGAGEGKVLFQQKQQQEKHHAQQEVVGVHHREAGLAGKAVELGELPVEHAAGHGQQRVDKGRVHIAFHFRSSFI